VLEILGVADAELVFETAESLADHDPRAALLAVEKLSASGRDITQFIRDLAAHLRHLFVVQTLGDVPDSFAVTAEQSDRVAAQAGRLAQGEVLRAIDLLAAGLSAVKDGSDPRIQLELALLKAVQPQADLSLQALLFRIEQLERRLAQAGAADAPPAGGAGEQENGSPSSAAPEARQAPVAGSRTNPGAQAATPRASVAGAPAAVAVAAQPDAELDHEPEPEPAPAPAEAGPELDLDRLRTLWPAVVDAVRSENAMVGACLEGARPSALDDDCLTISFPVLAGFSRKTVERNREILQTSLRALTGHSLALEYDASDEHIEADAPAALSEEELIERLKRDYGATEVFDDEPASPEGG
jgi:DNA polymerase-3 subunit gamma/tau